jgi:hypothetical protein
VRTPAVDHPGHVAVADGVALGGVVVVCGHAATSAAIARVIRTP